LAGLTAPIEISGYDIDMYGGDREHAPRHIHIQCSGEWEIRVYFRASVLADGIVFDVIAPGSRRNTDWCPLKKNQRKRLLELMIEHLDDLDAQWEELNPGRH